MNVYFYLSGCIFSYTYTYIQIDVSTYIWVGVIALPSRQYHVYNCKNTQIATRAHRFAAQIHTCNSKVEL